MGRYIKKATSLVLVITCLLTSIAFAAPGEVNLFAREEDQQNSPQSITSVGDSLYFLTNKGLYQWNKEMKEAALVSTSISTDIVLANSIIDQEGLDELYDKTVQQIFAQGEELFALNNQNGIWRKIIQDGENWQMEKMLDLDWEIMLVEEEYNGETYKQPPNIKSGFVQDNILYLNTETYTESGGTIDVFAFDLLTEKGERLPVEYIKCITSYTQGKLLGIQYDEQKAYEEANLSGGEVATPVMGVIDAKAGTFEPLTNIPYRDMTGLVYDEQSQSIYIAGDGKIWQWKQGENFKDVNYIPVHDSWECRPGIILPGLLYVAITENYKTYVRSIDPALKAQGVLTLSGASGQDKEIEAFQNERPEVPLALAGNYWETPSDIGQKLMMGDDSVDLYKLNTSIYGYQFLKNKGYLEHLSQSSILTQAVEKMYPAIQEVIQKDGELVAFPVELKIETMGYVAPVFENMKLEVPKTWKELMELFAWWGEEYGETYSGTYYLVSNSFAEENTASQYLFGLFVNDYIDNQMLTEGKLRFETPAFRQFVADFESLKPTIDLIKDTDSDRSMSWEDYPPLLLDDRSPVNPLGWNIMTSIPLMLPLEEGKDFKISGEMAIYVINPNSKNKELAMSFLETVAQNLSQEASKSFYADDNEPVEDIYFKQYVKEAEDRIVEYEKSLEKADEQDKKAIEEQIEDTRKNMEEMKNSNHYWTISPEAITLYRSYEGKWGVATNNPFTVDEQLSQFFMTQIESYLKGEIPVDTMIKELDNRIAMIELENQ